MDLTIQFRPNDHNVYREEEDGAFLFDPETGNLKYMNRAAKSIYLMLNGQNDIGKVIHNLQELYPDTGIEQLREDAEMLIQQLKENGFIYSPEG